VLADLFLSLRPLDGPWTSARGAPSTPESPRSPSSTRITIWRSGATRTSTARGRASPRP